MIRNRNFYSRASCEARREELSELEAMMNFYSRASCEARLELPGCGGDDEISTHAPRVRRDEDWEELKPAEKISTHAPRVRRDQCGWNPFVIHRISTHAPRVRRDQKTINNPLIKRISTHAPRVRRDFPDSKERPRGLQFLLTRLV